MAAALGLVADALGIISFIAGEAAGPAGGDVPTTVLRVYLGLNGDGLEDAQGGIGWNGVRLWNNVGEKIGMGGGTTLIADGTFKDIEIPQSQGNQAVTVDIVANTDSMCIGYLSNTMADGQVFSWTGDWGKICGLDYYYSHLEFAEAPEPYCLWIDADHTNDYQAGVISVHFPSFHLDEVPEGSDGTEFCGATEGIRAWRDDLDGKQILTPGGPVKRSSNSEGEGKDEGPRLNGRNGRAGKHAGDDRLVVSSRESHSAEALCEAHSSFGPDFVSLREGKYCDMDTREVMPLCEKGGQESTTGAAGPCFDLEAARNGTSSGVVGKRDISSVPRRRGVLEW